MGWVCPACGEYVDESGHQCPGGEFYGGPIPEIEPGQYEYMGSDGRVIAVQGDEGVVIEELHNPYLARIARALERIADALDPQHG